MRIQFPRRMSAIVLAFGAALVSPSASMAHARVDPAVSLSGMLQLYSLAVPTEKDKVTTTKVVLKAPSGFAIDSFAPSPGWQREVKQTGSGDKAVINQVTWTGGKTPTGEDAVFQFLARPQSSKTYKFAVDQAYSDGSIVSWSGAESSDSPAPTIETKSSLGGSSGTSIVGIIALVLAVLALLAGGSALTGARGRPLT